MYVYVYAVIHHCIAAHLPTIISWRVAYCSTGEPITLLCGAERTAGHIHSWVRYAKIVMQPQREEATKNNNISAFIRKVFTEFLLFLFFCFFFCFRGWFFAVNSISFSFYFFSDCRCLYVFGGVDRVKLTLDFRVCKLVTISDSLQFYILHNICKDVWNAALLTLQLQMKKAHEACTQ